MQTLGKVPTQGEIAIPCEVAAPCQWQGLIFKVLHITLLQLVIAAQDVGAEGQGLWRIVDVEILHNLQPLALALQLLERFEGLEVRIVSISEVDFPVLVLFPSSDVSRSVTAAM